MTQEEIMKQFANEHSYESWGELMYYTHKHSQIEYTRAVMLIYAQQEVKNISSNAVLSDEKCSHDFFYEDGDLKCKNCPLNV